MLIHTDRTSHSFRRAFVHGLLTLIIAGCGGGGGGEPPQSAPSNLSYASPVVLTVGVHAPTMMPTVTGSVTAYSISPALPDGLPLSASTGIITGAPVAESAASPYVATAQNAAGSTTFTLSHAVLVPAPSALSYRSPATYLIGTAISALSPTVTGLVTKYVVAPTLPAGLSLDAVTGQIKGTPTTATAMASYVITASNGFGSTTFSLTLRVLVPPPSALSYASPQTWISGIPISPISPSVTGTVTQYSVMPALPSGLLLNTATGRAGAISRRLVDRLGMHFGRDRMSLARSFLATTLNANRSIATAFRMRSLQRRFTIVSWIAEDEPPSAHAVSW